MNTLKTRLSLALLVLVLASLACGGSFSTANIANAYTTANPDGGSPTTVFSQDQTFYLIVEQANAPDDTSLKAVWTAVDIEGADPNTLIDEVAFTGGDSVVTFNLSNNGPWPLGRYKVDLYMNDTLDRTIEFEVR
ncbi:MAG: hypothetical protein HFACDABA_02396 [Anaerolineales bacterium]|nr:hypothetical protein [Anaerolineales bacterium]